jgi:MFS family permease
MQDEKEWQGRLIGAVPRGVWMVGFVSLFMDVSSEMIHAVLPLFVVGTLAASATTLGIIEGIAEATAQISKLFSGLFSDRWRNRKYLALTGYGLAAVVKPLFPLAVTVTEVFVARFADRIGKGIRGAPRDALVADITPADLRGAAFGLRQSLDTVGALIGPLLAVALMSLWGGELRMVLWAAVLPAFLSVAILAFGVSEPPRTVDEKEKPRFDLATAKSLGGAFWMVTGFAALMMLARFSEAFLVLKASASGLTLAFVPLVMVVMSGVYALASYPAGYVSDRFGRRPLLVGGLAALILADLVLALTETIPFAFIGTALWGLHMGLTQGILSSLVADAAAPALRGTAFGVFNLISGMALLVASLVAGMLWDRGGAEPVFLTGAGIAILALALSARMKPGQRQHAGS